MGRFSFGPLSDYLELDVNATPLRPVRRIMELEDLTMPSIGVAFQLHPDLELGWTRRWGSTPLRYVVDGVDVRENGGLPNGTPVTVPEFDVATDVVTFRWLPMRWRWKGIGATGTLGAGRMDLQQKGIFGLDSDVRPFDWSATDLILVVGAGARAVYKQAEIGIGVDLYHWKFDPPKKDRSGDDYRVDIPKKTVTTWVFGAHASFDF